MNDSLTRASNNGRVVRAERTATGLVPWLRRTIPFALVAAGLVGVALWGHRTDWTFTQTPPAAERSPPAPGELARVRVGTPLPARSDVPTAFRYEVTIEFDSADAVDAAGIGIAGVWLGTIADSVEASGEVGFDPALVARFGPRAAGTVWRVVKKAGDPVATGDVLALVDAGDMGKAKGDFQQALAQVRLREKTLAGRRAAADVVSAQSVREAEAAFAEAETRLLAASQALANLDLPINPADYRDLTLDNVIGRMRLLGVPPGTPGLDPKTATANLLPVRAPFAGVILSADAVAGEVVEPGRPIFVVADPRRVWVTLRVRAGDAGRVNVGQAVRFRTDGSAEEFGGKVEWVGRSADESTRTVPVRAALPNDAGRLRAGTLGQGRVVLRQEAKAILIPHDAVQEFRGTPVVFVRDPNYLKPGGPKAFRARPVKVGAKDAEYTEIVGGLVADEVVATKGSGLMLAELTRGIDGADTTR
ncbi:MAG: efflux RND transporter periplasmic adaptor subunit [Planctomycetes bacterium]|nr:efflux RND transporter periplasmic adaptor subunit [Planctomycetota bacterium]